MLTSDVELSYGALFLQQVGEDGHILQGHISKDSDDKTSRWFGEEIWNDRHAWILGYRVFAGDACGVS